MVEPNPSPWEHWTLRLALINTVWWRWWWVASETGSQKRHCGFLQALSRIACWGEASCYAVGTFKCCPEEDHVAKNWGFQPTAMGRPPWEWNLQPQLSLQMLQPPEGRWARTTQICHSWTPDTQTLYGIPSLPSPLCLWTHFSPSTRVFS